MKLYQKLISLLVAAVMAAVLMPVCMAAPGDSVETRVNNALAQRTGAELYQEIVTTAPDGTTQTMIAARKATATLTSRWIWATPAVWSIS